LAEPAAFVAGRPAFARRALRRAVSFTLVGLVVLCALAATLLPRIVPGTLAGRDATPVAAGAVFAGSYLALAVGRIPFLAIDRAGVALVGACLMVVSGAVSLPQAYSAIDLDTITLLLGVMIVVANLRLSGFFALTGRWLLRRARGPYLLLALVALASGVLSAFLVNDAICLVMAPLVLDLTLALRRPPTPYLLAVAMASNVGSTATITGNPQNILIGGLSHVGYAPFAARLAPVAAVGLVLTVALIAWAYRHDLAGGLDAAAGETPRPRASRFLVARSVAAAGAMIALFFAGMPPAKAAIIVGGLLLLTRRVRSARVYAEIDWSLLLMFVGLFIIVAGAQAALLTPGVVATVGGWQLDRLPVLSLVTAALSNLVSNVPAVLVLAPFVAHLPDQRAAWLTVAMASTLAGNFTVLGSIANLIVVQRAAARGVAISFWDYFRVGAPLTVATIAFGTFWLLR
jgi:Na+/H+ antiporter NhaD/arsenite permease-like protein